MVCVICLWDVMVGLLWVVPSFASWRVILLPKIPGSNFLYCYVMFGP